MGNQQIADKNFINKVVNEYKKVNTQRYGSIILHSVYSIELKDLYGVTFRPYTYVSKADFTDFCVVPTTSGDQFVCGELYGHIDFRYSDPLAMLRDVAEECMRNPNFLYYDLVIRDIPDLRLKATLSTHELNNILKTSVAYKKLLERVEELVSRRFDVVLHDGVYKSLRKRVNIVPMLRIGKDGIIYWYFTYDNSSALVSSRAMIGDSMNEIRGRGKSGKFLLNSIVRQSFTYTPYNKWLKLDMGGI